VPDDPTPVPVADDGNFRWRALVAAVVDQHTAEVIPALNAAGIRCILLKGPATVRRLYDDPLERFYEDADLLVDPQRFDDARQVLIGLGFSGGVIEVSPHVPEGYAEAWRREATVELHRSLSGIAAPPERVWAELSRDTERIELAGLEVEILSEAAQAFVVALHAAHHGTAAKVTLEDLERSLARIPLDAWREAACLAERLAAEAAFGAGLRLVEGGAELAARIDAGRDRSVEAELRAASAPHMALMLHWLRHGDASLAQKASVVLRKFVPPVEWMRARSPETTASRVGLARAYLRRPVELIRRLPSSARALRRVRRTMPRPKG
jgi:hypothetical protein